MPAKPAMFRPPHVQTAAQYDAERAANDPGRGWYKRAVWSHPVRGLRALQLRKQPLCEYCLAKTPPELTPATVVHHKRPHRGEWWLFADPDNLASACKACHDGELQAAEKAPAAVKGTA